MRVLFFLERFPESIVLGEVCDRLLTFVAIYDIMGQYDKRVQISTLARSLTT